MFLLVVLLALVAAMLFAAAAAVQQRAARAADRPAAADRSAPPAGTAARAHADDQHAGDQHAGDHHPTLRSLPALLGRLVRTRVWLIGWGINVLGFVCQAAALHFGSVALAQPLDVTQILFALLFAAIITRVRPTRLAWLSAAAMCGGVALFLSTRGHELLTGDPQRGRVLLVGAGLIVLVGLLVIASIGRSQLVHATLLAVGAGLWFAANSVLIKLTTDDLLGPGVAHTATDWPGYTLAATTVAGLMLEQGAFARGSLPGAVAAMSITNPIASYIIGVVVSGTLPPVTWSAISALVGAAILISAGVIGLAGTPSAHIIEPPTGEPLGQALSIVDNRGAARRR